MNLKSVLTFVIISIMFSLLSSQIQLIKVDGSSDPLGEGLVAYYKFNAGAENIAYDSSGNGNDGLVIGATWTNGKFGYALDFDGVNDYVRIPHSEVLSFEGIQPFTLGAWIRSDDAQGDKCKPVISKEKGDGEGSYHLYFDHVLSQWRSVIFSSDGIPYSAGEVVIDKGEWKHFAGVYDPPYMRGYVDGEIAAVNYVGYLEIDTNTEDVLIGASRIINDEITRWFDGVIDEVRIYNRAFDNAEIKLLSGEGPPYVLGVYVSKNHQETTANITVLDENNNTIGTVAGSSSYSWIVDSGRYYVHASISYNDFIYTSEEIEVAVSEYMDVAFNFPFSDFNVSCVDIENQPLENCITVFTRENELRSIPTDSLGFLAVEAYYGNWAVKAYWMDALVGEAFVTVNQSQTTLSLQCMVGDLTVIAVDSYGNPVEADVVVTNETYALTLSGQQYVAQGSLTFSRIPLINYDLALSGVFGTQHYQVDVGQTREIRVETLPLFEKSLFIMIGVAIGILIAFIGKKVLAKRQTISWR